MLAYAAWTTAITADVCLNALCPFEEFGLVESGEAVALAIVLSGRLPTASNTVAVALTGANVDPDVYQQALFTAF